MREHPIRALLRVLFRRVVGIYFRDVEVVGEVPGPEVGGRVFAANHVNALVDPILVLTSTECVISPIAKSTLWKIPGLRWLLDAVDAVPIVRRRDVPDKSEKDNDAVFERIAKHLRREGNILIFPEGTSHNEPKLVALRSGAGRMLARAHAEGGRRLTFQAVGLEFEERDIFRSRTLVVYGPVRDVDALGLSGDELAARVMEQTKADLSELLIEGETWEDRRLVARVAELFAHEVGDDTLEGWSAIGRRVEQAKRLLELGDREALGGVRAAVDAYYIEVERAGLTDDIVVSGVLPKGPGRALTGLFLLAVLPLALAAVPLYYLPYQLPRFVARRLSDERDVASTYKLGVGLLVYPLWLALLVGLAFGFLPREQAAAVAAVAALSPFAALGWLDRQDRLIAKLRAILPARGALADLRARRAEVMARLEEVRARVEPDSGR